MKITAVFTISFLVTIFKSFPRLSKTSNEKIIKFRNIKVKKPTNEPIEVPNQV